MVSMAVMMAAILSMVCIFYSQMILTLEECLQVILSKPTQTAFGKTISTDIERKFSKTVD